MIDIISVCNEFGIQVNRNNKALCPFHKEKTASFTIYRGTNTFHCFGCGKHGDAIQLMADLRGVPNKQMYKEVMQNKKMPKPCKQEQEKQKRAERAFSKWQQKARAHMLSVRAHGAVLVTETIGNSEDILNDEIFWSIVKQIAEIDNMLMFLRENPYEFYETYKNKFEGMVI